MQVLPPGREVHCLWREVTFHRFTAPPASIPWLWPGGACQQVLSLDWRLRKSSWFLEPSSLLLWSVSSGPGSPLPYAFGVLPRGFQMFPKKRPDPLIGLYGWPDTTLLDAA